jgi:GxxExxY protein
VGHGVHGRRYGQDLNYGKSRTMTTRGKFEGKHSELTGKIPGAFFQVHKDLGYGFSEKVYERALAILLGEMSMKVETQVHLCVYYHGQKIGEYIADLIVNDIVLLELKATEKIIEDHAAQLLNYLKATNIEVGLVLNFGPTAEFRRKIYDNERKGSLSWLNQSSFP